MLKREKVYRILAERIRSGQWQGGFKLPSEPLLCRELGVARVTLRAALEQLTSEGVLQRSRPGGTVVTADAELKKKIIVLSCIYPLSHVKYYQIKGGNFKSHSKNGKDAIRKELQRVVCTCYL